MPLRCSLMRHLRLRKGKTLSIATRMTPASSRSASRASCAPLERTGGGDRHSALSRLFRPGKAERKDRVQRAAGSQGTQKRPLAGPPGASMTSPVTHRLLHCGGCIVDNAIRAELT